MRPKNLHPDAYRRKRFMLIVLMVIFIPVGIGLKFYSGGSEALINNKLPGMLYVIFWSFFAAAVWVKAKVVIIVSWVLLLTCLIEITQLYSTPLLTEVRSTFIGRSLIGNSFNLADFPFYIAGAVVAYLWLKKVNRSYLI